MKAVVCRQYGAEDTLTLEDLDTPVPGGDEVLVRVEAAAVNDFDLGLLRGSPLLVRFFNGLVKPRVRILGCDVAGTVQAVGPMATGFVPGDRVFGDLCECGFGAFAEYVCVPERALRHMPAKMNFEQAAALPQAAVLAMQALFDAGGVRDGQRVLINGAGGGVGTIGLQMLRDCGVETTCVDRADKLDMLSRLGADHVIDFRRDDFTRQGRQYDLIVDTKTNRWPSAYLRSLRRGGIYATVGGSMIRIAALLARAPMASRGSDKRLKLVALKANKDLASVCEWFESGKLTPQLDRSFPLAETAEALRHFASGDHQGKVMIQVSSSTH